MSPPPRRAPQRPETPESAPRLKCRPRAPRRAPQRPETPESRPLDNPIVWAASILVNNPKRRLVWENNRRQHTAPQQNRKLPGQSHIRTWRKTQLEQRHLFASTLDYLNSNRGLVEKPQTARRLAAGNKKGYENETSRKTCHMCRLLNAIERKLECAATLQRGCQAALARAA